MEEAALLLDLEPIAIVGMGVRLPGADSVEALWDLLTAGRDAVRATPADRFCADKFRNNPAAGELARGKTASTRGGYLTQVDSFDPLFFGISPREAQSLDPQQRLLLEVTYEALEDAGMPLAQVAGSHTGVYVGLCSRDYQDFQTWSMVRTHSASGTSPCMAANRISYSFDLRGPSLALDTACSSGLYALHLACQSIWSGETRGALVGSVNLILGPGPFLAFSALGMLSPDGQCRAFDAAGKGFVRGEGAVVLVLKPLSLALRDQDRVYATVLSTAANQDGHQANLTVPTVNAQQELLREACRLANVNPRDISYVEAHGTGTPVGDPVEATALGTILGSGRKPADSLWVGSIKTNIGHLEASAGLAGLVKAALVAQRGVVPPNLHFVTPNPNIRWDEWHLRVPVECQRLTCDEVIVGVNSFGFGGANAHAILRQPPPAPRQPLTESGLQPARVVCLSARSPESLATARQDLAAYLGRNPSIELDELAYTTCLRRSHHKLRWAGASRDLDGLRALLSQPGRVRTVQDTSQGVAFVLAGQGPQWWAMGRRLLEEEAVFVNFIKRCDGVFQPLAGWSLERELRASEEASRIQDSSFGQPLLFVLQMGLARLLQEYGITPTAVVGHSLGEVAAACLAGVLTLEQGLHLVHQRGRMMAQTLPGKMVAAALDLKEAQAYLAPYAGRACLAGISGPHMVTLAGEPEAILAICDSLKAASVFHRLLPLNYAFHSHLMDPVQEPFLGALEGLTPNPARITLASSVSGQLTDGTDWDASYHWNNIRQPVMFRHSLAALIQAGYRHFLELSPNPTLIRTVQEALDEAGLDGSAVGTLERGKDDCLCFQQALANLHCLGFSPKWRRDFPRAGKLLNLPSYPWNRQRYWLEDPQLQLDRLAPITHPLLGTRMAQPHPCWSQFISVGTHPMLAHHRLEGQVIVPATAFVEAALAALSELVDRREKLELESLDILSPLFLGRELVHWRVECDEDLRAVHIYAHAGDEWVEHARAKMRKAPAQPPFQAQPDFSPEDSLALDIESFYRQFTALGLDYGPHFRNVRQLQCREGQIVWGRIELESPLEAGYLLHPALLDACLQICLPLHQRKNGDGPRAALLPAGLEGVRLHRPAGSELTCIARQRRGDTQTVVDFWLCDERGLVAELRGLLLRPWRGKADPDPFYQWEWLALEKLPPVSADAGNWHLAGDERLCKLLRPILAEGQSPAAGTVFLAQCGHEPNLPEMVKELQECARLALADGCGRLRIVLPQQDLASSCLRGLSRVIATEQPELSVCLVELASYDDPSLWPLLHAELEHGQEREVRLSQQGRWGHRLMRRQRQELQAQAAQPTAAEERFALVSWKPGQLEHLVLQAEEGILPLPQGHGTLSGAAEDCARVRVHCAGLNFSDVLKALDLYPGSPGGALDMGLEFSGQLPENGQRVMGLAPQGTFRSHLVTRRALLMPIPKDWSDEQGAAAPVAYLTAYYALVQQGRARAGESVLIHAATGGVGAAALALCRHLGLSVLATAGSPAKREWLRKQGLKHIFDSRSLEFEAKVMEATGGRGVDLVLNSLTDEFLRSSLRLLAPGGRFLEIGKRDIYSGSNLPMGPFRNNLSFLAIDLEQVVSQLPHLIQEAFSELSRLFESGQLPPLPIATTPVARAHEAFSTLQAARHIGKLVLSGFDQPQAAVWRDPNHLSAGSGSVLVAGGTGAFTRVVVEWLAEHGVGNFLLLSRGAESSPLQQEWADKLRGRGVRLEFLAGDITEPAAVQAGLARAESLGPLWGVVHGAMVLDDRPLEQQDAQSWSQVLAPKVLGAWNLHRAVGDRPLGMFLLFSSVSATLGSLGQANYAAANCFLEELAALRRRRGLAGQAVAWGAIGDVGVLAENQRLREHLGANGVAPMKAAGAAQLLSGLLGPEGPSFLAAELDWSRLGGWVAARGPFEKLVETTASSVSDMPADAPSRKLWLTGLLTSKVAQILGVQADQVGLRQPLVDLGMDSLMAVEVRNWIQDRFGLVLPATVMLRARHLEGLVEVALSRLEGDHSPAPADPIEPPPAVEKEARVEKPTQTAAEPLAIPEQFFQPDTLQDVTVFREFLDFAEKNSGAVGNPLFRELLNGPGATTCYEKRQLVQFASYNYLGLCGHPEVNQAAQAALTRFGTSVSSSRLVGGQCSLHRELEEELARFLGTEACLVLVSGHATNVSAISHLVGPGDLVIYDSLIHNSVVEGAVASRATRRSFPHNDLDALERLLQSQRPSYTKALLVVEGLYSMDGDFPDLPRLLTLRERYGLLMLVDEAHSLGTLGPRGRGLSEHFGLANHPDVIWMGTLSKTLASCGGYLAGGKALINWLRHTLPGFVYSVGLPPPSTAAALQALRILVREPHRVEALARNSSLFSQRARALGLNLGTHSQGPIVPIWTGDPISCLDLAQALLEDGFFVSPITYPAVPPEASRLRFFLTSEHSPHQIEAALASLEKRAGAMVPR